MSWPSSTETTYDSGQHLGCCGRSSELWTPGGRITLQHAARSDDAPTGQIFELQGHGWTVKTMCRRVQL